MAATNTRTSQHLLTHKPERVVPFCRRGWIVACAWFLLAFLLAFFACWCVVCCWARSNFVCLRDTAQGRGLPVIVARTVRAGMHPE